MNHWEFWIDVGGTFTDCLARTPTGEILTHKLLSSGMTPGVVRETPSPIQIVDPLRKGDPPEFWRSYACRLLDPSGKPLYAGRVLESDSDSGTLTLDKVLPIDLPVETRYELQGEEEAPVVAIRYLMKVPAGEPIPPIQVRLGTTRGTNALLTRRGAKTALITTRGFRDVLLIATQDRPKLFDLAIQKPEPLFAEAVEIDERIDAQGNVLKAPDLDQVRKQLEGLKQQGIESLAICLLHAFCNGEHEEQVSQIAREVGFDEISVSSRLAPLIKLVSRGDTTVVDAYLNPVLRSYVRGIRRSVGESSLKLMTSAGGLIDAENFVGKDSILSGPAGGVIGFSRIAERAGFVRSIGFDMGGTSTDVARFDGTYEREFETRKAGVRIVAPMLAVETVAAGGGSLCKFDGVKLVVGPESAGANPGPACYGRGGPLTVTDMNLFSGKIPQEDFPFPLDRKIVEEKLQALCDEIAKSSLAARYTPYELAAGFLQIANANMVRAIRNISVARGYDPRDYTLVTFGGAGGQHACAVARTLGITRVLAHPLSGVLSAYGIGLADIRQFGEQMVLQPYSAEEIQSLEAVFAGLEQSARDKILAEDVLAENIAPANRSLDLRYQGVETALNIAEPADGDYIAAFESQHKRIYGYVHPHRPLEIVTARIEVVGTLPRQELPSETSFERRPEAGRYAEVEFQGIASRTPIFKREELHAGDLIDGPAIICEPTSTVVIDPGFQGQVLQRGELLLTDLAGEQKEEGETAVDPVRLEVFNNLFASIAEQMGTTLQRTSCSTNVKERLDFSCAIFTATGDLVVNAPHIPVHLGAMSVTVKRILQDNPDLSPGDVFVTNDPYRGGSHLPDVTVITPVHSSGGELLFLTASRAHHAEIGGIVPGSMPPFSKTLAEEGVLIRNFKLVDRGESREAELSTLLTSGPYPTRRLADNLADISAQVAANQTGVSQLLALVERYTWRTVRAYMGHIQNAAATKMRMALAALHDGEYAFEDHLDDGSPICVKITKQGETAVVDFTGTGPVLAGNLNANRAIVQAAVLYVFRCLIAEEIPLNSGVLEPIQIILPECLLNPLEHDDPAQCAAIVGGNVETSQRVVDVMLGALGLAAASQGTMNNFTFGDGTFGYYETICGGSGATPEADGADGVHTHMTNTRLTDVEVIERKYPIRVLEFSLRQGSGGKGKHHGGDGVIRRIEFLKPLNVSLLTERRGDYAPFGLQGGSSGKQGMNSLLRRGSTAPEQLPGKVQLEVQPGDRLTIETPGGGGYGSD